VLVSVLKRLDQSQRFIHGAANWEIVHRYLANSSLVINDEQRPGQTIDIRWRMKKLTNAKKLRKKE
jgi:hypothetical protein